MLKKWLRNLGEKDNRDIQQMAASVARQNTYCSICRVLNSV
jgi:hypothetical protein